MTATSTLRRVREGDTEDILIRITATNRGPEAASPSSVANHMVPQYVVLGRLKKPRPDAAGRCRVWVILPSSHRPRSTESAGSTARIARTAFHRKRDELEAAVRTTKPYAVRQRWHP